MTKRVNACGAALAVFSIAFAAGLALCPRAQAQVGPRITAILIEIEGQEPGSPLETAARRMIELEVGDVYDEKAANADLARILSLGVFDERKCYHEVRQDIPNVILVFHLVTYPKIRSIEFEGNTLLDDDTLRKVIEPALSVGNYYSTQALSTLNDLITRAYVEKGYFARMAQAPICSEQGDVVITILEYFVSKIEIQGLEKTKEWIVRREIEVQVGQLYNDNDVNEDIRDLQNLGIFEEVQVERRLDEDPTVVGGLKLIYKFQEKKTGVISVGIGISSREGFVGFGEISEMNFRGEAERILLRAELGGIRTFDLAYADPWFDSQHTSIEINVYDKQVRTDRFAFAGGFSSPIQSLELEDRRGFMIAASRPLGDDEDKYVQLRYRNETVRTQDPRLTILAPQLRQGSIGSLSLAFVLDTRDFRLDPREGSLAAVEIEQGGGIFGGRFPFTKYQLDLRKYIRAGEDNVFAFRGVFGKINGAVPIFETLPVGGADTLRGYREDRFFGTNRVLLSFEYRRQISRSSGTRGVQGVLFVDYGSAWGGQWVGQDGTIFRAEHQRFTGYLGYGIGVRVLTPLGPIRLDYGIGSEGPRTHFGIAQTF